MRQNISHDLKGGGSGKMWGSTCNRSLGHWIHNLPQHHRRPLPDHKLVLQPGISYFQNNWMLVILYTLAPAHLIWTALTKSIFWANWRLCRAICAGATGALLSWSKWSVSNFLTWSNWQWSLAFLIETICDQVFNLINWQNLNDNPLLLRVQKTVQCDQLTKYKKG